MPENDGRFERLMQQLETERDELRLKLGLAKLEVKKEWEELDKKMETLRGRMRVLGGEAKEASGDVGAALDVLADEVKVGFARIKKML
jgi:hypothetical protein